MFDKINNWLFNLTKNNWGLPWHIILACFGSALGFRILDLFLSAQPFLWKGILIWIVVNVIGFGYEAYQKKKKGPDKVDFFQDILANNIGIFLGWL